MAAGGPPCLLYLYPPWSRQSTGEKKSGEGVVLNYTSMFIIFSVSLQSNIRLNVFKNVIQNVAIGSLFSHDLAS
jgi:hypothetical protein